MIVIDFSEVGMIAEDALCWGAEMLKTVTFGNAGVRLTGPSVMPLSD
jgi:hypothetical protein